MRRKRLRAPSEDGSILELPALADLPELLSANKARTADWKVDLQGRRSDLLREKAREEVFALARAYHAEAGLPAVPDSLNLETVVAAGHQPELFHPGVWVKNFALAGLARRVGAPGLNLVVDNDIPKGATLKIPAYANGVLSRSAIDFDIWTSDAPFEAQAVVDRDRFATFGLRLREALAGLIDDPLVERLWPLVGEPRRTENVGLLFASARRLIEESWGVSNFEVPLSRVCESDAFLWFASHLFAHLPRFQAIHNEELYRYRKLNGIRSKNHPVADLRADAEGRFEAPFWVWRDAHPRRRSLWVRTVGARTELWIPEESEPFLSFPLGPETEACCAVEALRELPARGIRLRTRALTTTMFARLFLSDLFIHGIGGAKYDELGDEIALRFHGIRPPDYSTVSMTLHLGLPSTGATPDALRALDRLIRELKFNPDRHLNEEQRGRLASLLAEKREAVGADQATRRLRVERFHRLRRLNAAIGAEVRPELERAEEERRRLVADLRREAVARGREYSIAVHSEAKLRRVLTNLTRM